MGTFTKLALGVVLLGGGTLALAHPHADHKDGVKETIVIKRVHGEPGVRRDVDALVAKCKGAPDVDVSDEGKDGGKVRRSRVIICNDGKMGPDVVKALESARERLAQQDTLSAEARSKALAAIDAAIARHREAK